MTAMTPEQFAARLNGRTYGSEITKAEEAEAKAAGLVVVFGYSDDNVELRGAIHEEIGAYNGTTFRVTPAGLLESWPEDDPVHEAWAAAYFERKNAGYSEIEAEWDGGNGYAWTYSTTIPHTTFDVLDEGERFCRGIVFRLADTARPNKDAADQKSSRSALAK